MDFAAASERSKRRRTAEIRTTHSTEELSYATQMKFRSAKKLDVANIIKEITTSPTRASKYKAAFIEASNPVILMSDDAALSIVVESKLTKHHYLLFRQSMNKHNCNLYPPYYKVLQAKIRCYPRSDVTITEISAEVKLQALLNHTTERILLVQNNVIKSLKKTVIHMKLISGVVTEVRDKANTSKNLPMKIVQMNMYFSHHSFHYNFYPLIANQTPK